jgi:hypothetical protein
MSGWFKPTSEELIQGAKIRRELSTDYELRFTANDLYVFVGAFGTYPGFRAGISTDPKSTINNARDRCCVSIEWPRGNGAL